MRLPAWVPGLGVPQPPFSEVATPFPTATGRQGQPLAHMINEALTQGLVAR